MEYYQKLRNLREDADKKQEDIAKVLGITRQQYGLYETVSADYILGLPTGLPYGHSRTRSQCK